MSAQTPDQQIGTGAGQPNTAVFPKRDGGRGNPPSYSRFKPGVSGNPSGRPRGSKSLKTILDGFLMEAIDVREGRKVRKMTKYEALLQAQWQKGVQGDTRAAKFIQDLANTTGLFVGTNEADQVLSRTTPLFLTTTYVSRLRHLKPIPSRGSINGSLGCQLEFTNYADRSSRHGVAR